MKNKEKVFAKGYCFTKLFIFFFLGCLLGTYYEEILFFLKHGKYSRRSGLLWGPFSPTYGFGVVIFIFFLGRNNKDRGIIKTFIYAALIGGITEFAVSWISDIIFDVQFWDYSHEFLNIMGRTTIPFMIFWGIGGTVLMKFIYPFLSKLIEKIPYQLGKVIYLILLIFMTLDMIVTYTAFGRMTLRNHGVRPFTFVGKFYDHVYPNEYMYKRFPVMEPDP